jgi:site-specific DNA recombinase
MSAKRRCAIYVRTSTEEGLGQDFNSLNAQGEACSAYIKSQISEGWSLKDKPYEDGGFSGGSLDRPAFQRLLADIKAGRIDVVVVYKVDRLTRSLADFAKIMEVLDAAGASFVSVTQSFNTTTSMGRLTLNVLLSFAQFEREVTGERIRDKVAASKAKGMWMGGKPPLGYDPSGRSLIINEGEAERVRLIFERFIALQSVVPLVDDLRARGVLSKRWKSSTGITHGGLPITRGALYAVLTNPIYRGMIRHKGKIHQGQHQAIISVETWDAAQSLLTEPGARASPTAPSDWLLGKVFDDAGHPMAATCAQKGSARYRYYASEPSLRGRKAECGSLHRIATCVLDQAVLGEIRALLDAHWRVQKSDADRAQEALSRVEVSTRSLLVELRTDALDPMLVDALPASHQVERLEHRIRVRCPILVARPRGACALIRTGASGSPRHDRTLIRAVALAHVWANKLETGNPRSIIALAKAEKLCVLHTAKLLPLAYLAPDLIETILAGRQPPAMTLTSLLAEPLPFTWPEQRARFVALS